MPTSTPSLFLASVASLCLSGCGTLYNNLGGPYTGPPSEAYTADGLGSDSRLLIEQAFVGFEDETLRDFHVHFFGNGWPKTYKYCPELNRLENKLRPRTNFKRVVHQQEWWQRPFIRGIYLDTLDVSDEEEMDDQYMRRLVDLVANHGPPEYANSPATSPYKTDFYLMAMDGVYDSFGKPDESSFNIVSNEFVVGLVHCLNQKLDQSGRFVRNRFQIVGSINPLRRADGSRGAYVMRDRDEWLSEIQYLHDNGIEWIKWRPPSMEIDPEEVSVEFYSALKRHGIGILTHTGSSNGLKLHEDLNQYAAPEKMRKAIELGVDVVMLHIGRTGSNRDTKEAFSDEFFRMQNEYNGTQYRLRGEISAVPYDDSYELLQRVNEKAQRRENTVFMNGSDYPAVTPYIFVRKTLSRLQNAKWLSESQTSALDSIFRYNPLLFDFVLKRTLVTNGIDIPDNVFLGEWGAAP